MAKSNSFFGLRRGSTKTLTFQVLEGKQITKDRVSEVKNPRTIEQMRQRMILKTIGLGYSTMKTICDHSFEQSTYGMQSMQKFMQDNLSLIKKNMTKFGFAEFNDSTPNMGQFKISEGSLASPIQSAASLSFESNKLTVSLPSTVATTLDVANAFGVALGDIVTLVALVQTQAGNVMFAWVRFIISSAEEAISNTSIKVQSNLSVAATYTSGVSAVVTFAAVDGVNASSAALYAFIRSQKQSSGFKRSTQYLNHAIGNVKYDLSYEKALATYPVGQAYILNGENSKNDGGSNPALESFTITNNATANITAPAKAYAGATVTLTLSTAVTSNQNVYYTPANGVRTLIQAVTTTTPVNTKMTFNMPMDNVTISMGTGGDDEFEE